MPLLPRDTHSVLVPAGDYGEMVSRHAFCPVGGLRGDSLPEFRGEVRCLLTSRLRTATLIILGGFSAFLIRNVLVPFPGREQILVPHVGVVLILGALCGLLFVKRSLSVLQLRAVEFVAFAVPAAFFVWLQHCRVQYCPQDLRTSYAAAFPSETVLPWLVLIQVYGFFIPNTWQRAGGVISLMAAVPLIGSWASANQCPEVARVLSEEGRLSAMVLWMAIGAMISVYGAHRYGRLRREVFDARRIGVYTLRERLGSGGMGDVYLAEHRLLKRRCAIKLIKPEKAGDPDVIPRFESEVRSAARLTHPHTIEIYDYGVTRDGTFYYVMEYLPGLNLQDIVERDGPLPPERVVHLLRAVCSALREAHDQGLVHRDIKPSNIFAAQRGGIYDFAKLLDFGLVKSLQPEEVSVKLTQLGAVVGSPLFAAPEAAIDGEPTPLSDIYSLGATAYYLLTGRPVFPGENALKVLFSHTRDVPQPLSELRADVPPELEAAVMKCLAKNPADRFQSVTQLQEALERCPAVHPWTQERARDWWSQKPVDLPLSEVDEASAETAVTAVMNLPD